MLRQTSLLVSLVLLMDRLPWPSEPTKRPRGRPKTYSDRLILKALVIMIIRRLYTAYAFLTFLEQDQRGHEIERAQRRCGHSCTNTAGFRPAVLGSVVSPHCLSTCPA